jgi:hypothetical protein
MMVVAALLKPPRDRSVRVTASVSHIDVPANRATAAVSAASVALARCLKLRWYRSVRIATAAQVSVISAGARLDLDQGRRGARRRRGRHYDLCSQDSRSSADEAHFDSSEDGLAMNRPVNKHRNEGWFPDGSEKRIASVDIWTLSARLSAD